MWELKDEFKQSNVNSEQNKKAAVASLSKDTDGDKNNDELMDDDDDDSDDFDDVDDDGDLEDVDEDMVQFDWFFNSFHQSLTKKIEAYLRIDSITH